MFDLVGLADVCSDILRFSHMLILEFFDDGQAGFFVDVADHQGRAFTAEQPGAGSADS